VLLGLRYLPGNSSATAHNKNAKASALLFESGEMAVTLPTAALPSCWFGFTNVKLKSKAWKEDLS